MVLIYFIVLFCGVLQNLCAENEALDYVVKSEIAETIPHLIHPDMKYEDEMVLGNLYSKCVEDLRPLSQSRKSIHRHTLMFQKHAPWKNIWSEKTTVMNESFGVQEKIERNANIIQSSGVLLRSILTSGSESLVSGNIFDVLQRVTKLAVDESKELSPVFRNWLVIAHDIAKNVCFPEVAFILTHSSFAKNGIGVVLDQCEREQNQIQGGGQPSYLITESPLIKDFPALESDQDSGFATQMIRACCQRVFLTEGLPSFSGMGGNDIIPELNVTPLIYAQYLLDKRDEDALCRTNILEGDYKILNDFCQISSVSSNYQFLECLRLKRAYETSQYFNLRCGTSVPNVRCPQMSAVSIPTEEEDSVLMKLEICSLLRGLSYTHSLKDYPLSQRVLCLDSYDELRRNAQSMQKDVWVQYLIDKGLYATYEEEALEFQRHVFARNKAEEQRGILDGLYDKTYKNLMQEAEVLGCRDWCEAILIQDEKALYGRMEDKKEEWMQNARELCLMRDIGVLLWHNFAGHKRYSPVLSKEEICPVLSDMTRSILERRYKDIAYYTSPEACKNVCYQKNNSTLLLSELCMRRARAARVFEDPEIDPLFCRSSSDRWPDHTRWPENMKEQKPQANLSLSVLESLQAFLPRDKNVTSRSFILLEECDQSVAGPDEPKHERLSALRLLRKRQAMTAQSVFMDASVDRKVLRGDDIYGMCSLYHQFATDGKVNNWIIQSFGDKSSCDLKKAEDAVKCICSCEIAFCAQQNHLFRIKLSKLERQEYEEKCLWLGLDFHEDTDKDWGSSCASLADSLGQSNAEENDGEHNSQDKEGEPQENTACCAQDESSAVKKSSSDLKSQGQQESEEENDLQDSEEGAQEACESSSQSYEAGAFSLSENICNEDEDVDDAEIDWDSFYETDDVLPEDTTAKQVEVEKTIQSVKSKEHDVLLEDFLVQDVLREYGFQA